MTASSRSLDWGAFACRPTGVITIWLCYCIVGIVLMKLSGSQPVGTDDYMRLFEVRDLLAGQSWWDVTQYRIDPPQGASMHWSRLVDLPLALFAVLFGEQAAMVVVPLLYLLAALFGLRAIMLRLGLSPLAMTLGLLAMPLFPMLPGQFMPMRIDHHSAQAVLAIWCAALLLGSTRATAALAGVLAAAWVSISLEGLPLVATLGGMFGLAYLGGADDGRRLRWFLGALAIAAPVISLATRPVSAFSLPYCDILLPGHMAAFAIAAIVASGSALLPGRDDWRQRLAILLAIPLAAGPVAFVSLGQCVANPMSNLDPVLQEYWFSKISEGLPIWDQRVSRGGMLLWTILLVVVGWRTAASRREEFEGRALAWNLLALLALAAGAYSLLVLREGMVSQWLAIPFAAYLLGVYLPRARAISSTVPRILTTVACVLLATPTFASASLKPFDPYFGDVERRERLDALTENGRCDYSRLADLPPGLVLGQLNAGAEIVYRSGHPVVAANYHRNQESMRGVIETFIGPVADAEQFVRTKDVDYVIACASLGDTAMYRIVDPDNFINALVAGDLPGWLEPVDGFEDGPLRVYRVR